jgi:hypothetical protein
VSASSPCLGRGSYLATTGTDIDGAPWANPPAIGCDEQRTGLAAGPLTVTIGTSYPLYSYTKVAVGFSMELQALISGPVTASRWEFGDGTVTSNRPYASHCWSAAGDYSIALRAYNQTYPSGLAATVTVHVVTQAVHYVALGNPAPVAPYSTWATAATNIQNAVDVATVTGALVLVSNGVYQTGSRSVSGSMYNRVAVTKPLVVSSVNGANSTVIKGNRVLGNSAVRCVYLASGACLTGFTLTNGATLTSGYLFQLISGGGVWCQSNNCVVSDCIITANSASACGGGAFGGTLTNCTVSSNGAGAAGGGACCGIVNNCPLNNNSANIGGGAYGCTLSICTLISNSVSGTGGGTDSSTLNNCTLTGNSATSSTSGGGGANASALNNCVVSGNKAYLGGGTYSCKLRNCTLTGNSASKYGGDMNSELNNCILYFNTATNVVPDYGGSVEKLSYCCTTPTPIDGIGNITSPPLFVDQAGGDFRLQSDSPCINAGNNACVSASTDLDGNPRIAGSTVDIGAYEYQSPASVLSYAWAQQYGLPTDGSQDFADLDGDGFNNWQEWMAGTLPNSAASALRVLPLTRNSSGVVVTWQSISNQAYCVERSMRLGSHPAFYTLATSIAGQPDWTSYTDTTAAGPGPFFYRVAVMTSSYQAQLPGSIIPLAWLQQYGLPMDGSADFLDSDGDGMSNWAEWRAGTNPTDPSSALRMMSATKAASGLNVTWQSVSNRSYYLERATDLSSASPFQSQATGIPGAADYTTYTDTTATNGGPYFYRIGVQ